MGTARMLRVFADYQVIDDLLRIETGNYVGKHEQPLSVFRAKASSGEVTVFMSEIT